MKGIKFGTYHTYDDFNMILSEKRIGSPSPKIETIDVPGGDGVLDDDPDWYYVGRITVSEWKAEKNIGKLTIDCDCDPFKYKKDETVVLKTVSGSTSFNLLNSRKNVVPTNYCFSCNDIFLG